MILLVNVIITDQKRFHFHYPRYGLPEHNKIDIFRYTLASYAAVQRWSKVLIYCELDDKYKTAWNSLSKFIKLIFPADTVELYPHRNHSLAQWRQVTNKLMHCDDDLVWFFCNHDHIFVDSDLKMVDKMISILQPHHKESATCFHSHWPEGVRFAAANKATQVDSFLRFQWSNSDAMQIITKKLLHNLWFSNHNFQGNLTRTDGLANHIHMPVTTYVPTKEIVRHFDGYGHAMPLGDLCPPLTIPPGFWTNNIKILYCFKQRREGWVNVDPRKPFITVDPKGADFRGLLEDLPLFWQNRISRIVIDEKIKPRSLIEARDAVILETATCRRRCGNREYPVFDPIVYASALKRLVVPL